LLSKLSQSERPRNLSELLTKTQRFKRSREQPFDNECGQNDSKANITAFTYDISHLSIPLQYLTQFNSYTVETNNLSLISQLALQAQMSQISELSDVVVTPYQNDIGSEAAC
jgi:hypothetical protein